MALSQQCLINGESYAWSHIDFPLFGQVVEGVSEISYSKKQEKTNNYGRGTKPVSRGRGKQECEGSITIEMKEAEWIKVKAAGGLLGIKPFHIPVVFSGDGITMTTHVLQFCEFTEVSIEAKSGDTTINVTLPLIIGDIKGL